MKKSRWEICYILGFGVIFSLAIQTGKFLLWRQGSTPWNPKVGGKGVGMTSSDWMEFSGTGSLLLLADIPSRRSVAISASVTVIPRLPAGRMVRGSLHLPFLWTCLHPTLVGPLMKLWRIQGKVSINKKGLLHVLLLWYTP